MDRGLLDNLKDILQERISFSESVRNNHAKGEDAYDPVLPRAVLFPKNNDELSKILKICNGCHLFKKFFSMFIPIFSCNKLWR